MLIVHQFGIIQNLQTLTIPQTSFMVGTFFAISYSKPALGLHWASVVRVYSRLEDHRVASHFLAWLR